MKVVACLFATLTVASAFAPATNGRTQTTLSAAEPKKKFFQTIFDMDLFSPNPDQNDYGARGKKNLAVGSIGSDSYVPDGMSAGDYAKIRSNDKAKRDKNYQKNVAKAGIFSDFDKFYTQRGTDNTQSWVKTVGRGHTFAKTKYDFSGQGGDEKKNFDGSS